MKVLITGGAGFIGSHIADLFTEEGYKVVIIDNLSTGSEDQIPNNCTLYKTDILSQSLEAIFSIEKPEVIIHQAAQVSVVKSNEDPLTDAENNILTTIRLLELAHKYKVKKFIFSSSSAVYGVVENVNSSEDSKVSPTSFYGLSKYVSELYIFLYSQMHNIPFTIFRYSNVYGPRQVHPSEGGVISIFINNVIHKQAPIIYGDGNQSRDFIFVKDIARANLLALEHGHNEIFNLSTNIETSISDLWKAISELGKFNANPIFKEARAGEIKNSVLCNDKAKKNLNWFPVYSLEEGLAQTFNYYINAN